MYAAMNFCARPFSLMRCLAVSSLHFIRLQLMQGFLEGSRDASDELIVEHLPTLGPLRSGVFGCCSCGSGVDVSVATRLARSK
jgi:hypothetical protein